MVCIFISISIIFVYFGICIAEDDIHVPGYYRWTYDGIATPDLLCPECCKTDNKDQPRYEVFSSEQTIICCVRKAMPYWKFLKYHFLRSKYGLHIGYMESNETPFVYDIFAIFGHVWNFSFYDLDHQFGKLKAFPDNLCQFPKIVWLNFSNNAIENTTDLGCLMILDTLDLSYNRLEVIRSSTFANLPYLRHLWLSNNLITTLEPETFKYHPRSLKYVNLSHNRMLTLDITNVILGYFFSVLDYSHNFMSNLTNLSKWKGFQDKDQIGGGLYLVNDNNFTGWPNLTDYGFKTIDSAMRLGFNYHADYRNNPWICDCSAYQLINIGVQAELHFRVEAIECSQPISLRGYNLREFRKNKELLNELTCNVTMKQQCPPKCYCFKQPSKNRVVVNCSLSDKNKMPYILPELDNLDIDLSKNRIQVFQNFDYLRRTIKIDLSHNNLHEIDPAIFTIRKIGTINLYNNSISSLDRSIQLKSPCKLRIGHVSLSQCTCAMNWMTIWLEKQTLLKCTENINMISCIDGDSHINLANISENKLCPRITRNDMTYVGFVVAIFVILVLFLLYHQYRYEILLILRHYNIGYFSRSVERNIVYDVYLSFNVDNNDVTTWVIRILVPHLEGRGYKVCLPPRDFEIGGIHSDQILEKIIYSHSFFIILSEDYFKSQFQAIEWMHLWNAFKTDIDSNLVIINYDILKVHDLKNGKLKAFIRLGYSLEFSNFKNDLFMEIEKRLKSKNSNGNNM